jgi:hypothetical protein
MTKIKKYKTNFLVPNTSFLIGMGSIMNIQGNYFDFNYSDTLEEADSKAIENDWGVVGNDLRRAINKLIKEPQSQV